MDLDEVLGRLGLGLRQVRDTEVFYALEVVSVGSDGLSDRSSFGLGKFGERDLDVLLDLNASHVGLMGEGSGVRGGALDGRTPWRGAAIKKTLAEETVNSLDEGIRHKWYFREKILSTGGLFC